METPEPDVAVARETLSRLDPRGVKIVYGLFALMIQDPSRVRDREWICEQLTQVTLLAGDFEAETPELGVSAVQAFLVDHADPLLEAAYLLFQRVGLDIASRASEGFALEDAMGVALSYLPDTPPEN